VKKKIRTKLIKKQQKKFKEKTKEEKLKDMMDGKRVVQNLHRLQEYIDKRFGRKSSLSNLNRKSIEVSTHRKSINKSPRLAKSFM